MLLATQGSVLRCHVCKGFDPILWYVLRRFAPNSRLAKALGKLRELRSLVLRQDLTRRDKSEGYSTRVVGRRRPIIARPLMGPKSTRNWAYAETKSTISCCLSSTRREIVAAGRWRERRVDANDQQLMHTCTSRRGQEGETTPTRKLDESKSLVFKSYASQVFQLQRNGRDRHDPQQRPSGIKAPSRPEVLLDQLLSELQLFSLLSLAATHRLRLPRRAASRSVPPFLSFVPPGLVDLVSANPQFRSRHHGLRNGPHG